MGTVYAEVELVNATDLDLAKRNLLDRDEVKNMRVNLLVDSGAYMAAINETMKAQLGLSTLEYRKAQMADGRVVEYEVVGPIHFKFKNRTATGNAFVLEGDNEPLLGVLQLEEMDVLIDPRRQQLIVNPEHPNYAQLKMKGCTPISNF